MLAVNVIYVFRRQKKTIYDLVLLHFKQIFRNIFKYISVCMKYLISFRIMQPIFVIIVVISNNIKSTESSFLETFLPIKLNFQKLFYKIIILKATPTLQYYKMYFLDISNGNIIVKISI